MGQSLSVLRDTSYEDDIFIKNICTWAKNAENPYFCKFSMFLGDRQMSLATLSLDSEHCKGYKLYGGYPDAQRKILAVYGESCEPSAEQFPISAVTFRYKREYKLSHRDFLGVLMSLEIKRECIGDIVVGDGICVVFLTTPAIHEILAIDKVGRIGVEVSEGCDALSQIDLSQRFTHISGSVSSLRLDAIVALAVKTSRGGAQQLISSKCVSVNGFTAFKDSYMLDIGDTFTVRGYGKFVVSESGGSTRKNRLHIEIKKYV